MTTNLLSRHAGTTIIGGETSTSYLPGITRPAYAHRVVRCMASAEQREKLKAEVIRSVANTKRGKAASTEKQREILLKVEALEAMQPTKNPALSHMISGRWSLLYTGPGRVDDLDWERRTGGVEGPVLNALKPLSANAVRNKGITQIIDKEAGTVENLAEFTIAGALDGYLNVEGTVAPVVPETGEATRVDVRFTAFSLKLGPLPALKIPLAAISPKGWVETTYLDDDVRVGRGDKGSIFVTARQKSDKASTKKLQAEATVAS